MKALMDKYLVLIKIYFKAYKKYPAGIFLKLIYIPVQMLMYIFLWLYISKVNDVDLKYIISYYLLTNLLIYAYPFLHISNDIMKDVIEGGLTNYLVRPVNYIHHVFAKYIAWMFIYAIIFIPCIIFIYIFNDVSLVQIINFICFAVVGSMIEFMVWYIVGLTSFFIERIKGVITTIYAIRLFVSGSIIPLSFLPRIFHNATYFFPFRFYIYEPVNTLLSNMSLKNIHINLMMAFIWLISLIILSSILWKLGLKRVQSNMS
ncbi:MAG: ABC-2 family transporter protein [Herbinix sp.]|nr:ABC-2 family transporter protein [Herbinix sp.]